MWAAYTHFTVELGKNERKGVPNQWEARPRPVRRKNGLRHLSWPVSLHPNPQPIPHNIELHSTRYPHHYRDDDPPTWRHMG